MPAPERARTTPQTEPAVPTADRQWCQRLLAELRELARAEDEIEIRADRSCLHVIVARACHGRQFAVVHPVFDGSATRIWDAIDRDLRELELDRPEGLAAASEPATERGDPVADIRAAIEEIIVEVVLGDETA